MSPGMNAVMRTEMLADRTYDEDVLTTTEIGRRSAPTTSACATS
jgi:hypothetical protein